MTIGQQSAASSLAVVESMPAGATQRSVNHMESSSNPMGRPSVRAAALGVAAAPEAALPATVNNAEAVLTLQPGCTICKLKQQAKSACLPGLLSLQHVKLQILLAVQGRLC